MLMSALMHETSNTYHRSGNFAFKINFVVETNRENLTREKKLCGDIVRWQSINKRARMRKSTPSTCCLCLHCLLVARNTPSIPLACPLPLGSVLCPPPLRHPPTLYRHSMSTQKILMASLSHHGVRIKPCISATKTIFIYFIRKHSSGHLQVTSVHVLTAICCNGRTK